MNRILSAAQCPRSAETNPWDKIYTRLECRLYPIGERQLLSYSSAINSAKHILQNSVSETKRCSIVVSTRS
jgi:hypothetical protein